MIVAEVSLGQVLFAFVVVNIFSNVAIIMAIYGKDIFSTKK